MTEVISVRFKNAGKVYYFAPDGHKIQTGQHVIVETARGVEFGDVVNGNHEVPHDKTVQPLKKVIRLATKEDEDKLQKNIEKENEAFSVCQKKITERKLDMKLIDVEYTFDNNKILFYFTSDGRVDFRDLVKDLASVFRTRIELRQIGVRDESKMLGGLGICGRPLCCSTFLGEFHPVSIKMAKEQNLSLNPTKISGTCGRLMCCLKYEQDAYEALARITPKPGALVETADGRGIVTEINIIAGVVKIRSESDPQAAPKPYKREDVKTIKDVKVTVDKEELKKFAELED